MADLVRRRCRGRTCRAEILLVRTVAGKMMPIDVEPSPGGNVLIEHDLLGEPYVSVLNIRGIAEARRRGLDLFMPHHATCPDVADFREARGG